MCNLEKIIENSYKNNKKIKLHELKKLNLQKKAYENLLKILGQKDIKIDLEELNVVEYLDEIMILVLTKKQYKVVCLRSGIGVDSPKTLKEIGDKIGMTKEGVRKIEIKAYKILSEELKKYSNRDPKQFVIL